MRSQLIEFQIYHNDPSRGVGLDENRISLTSAFQNDGQGTLSIRMRTLNHWNVTGRPIALPLEWRHGSVSNFHFKAHSTH